MNSSKRIFVIVVYDLKIKLALKYIYLVLKVTEVGPKVGIEVSTNNYWGVNVFFLEKVDHRN